MAVSVISRICGSQKQANGESPVDCPGSGEIPGAGINPGFLWDNPAYLLGFKKDDPKPERTRKSFEAFRDKHLALRQRINCAEFDAVCAFLEHWEPAQSAEHPIFGGVDDRLRRLSDRE